MEMTIPSVCRGKCSANVCPHAVIHESLANKRKCFSNCIQDTSLKLAFLAIFLSQSKKTLQYCQCLLCSWSVLAFHKFCGLFGYFPVRLISWIYMNTLPAKTQPTKKRNSLALFHPAALTLPWVPEVFLSRATRSFVGRRPKTRAGHFIRLNRNRKPRMKSLWHPVYVCAVSIKRSVHV